MKIVGSTVTAPVTPPDLAQYANAIKDSVAGTGTVQLDKVSPIEHELAVRLSSKNQANLGDVITGQAYRDTSYSINTGSSNSRFEPFACKPSTTYTMSSNSLFHSIWWLDKDKKPISSDVSVARTYLGGNYQPYTFTTAENCEYIALNIYSTKNGEPNPFEWLQLEEGTVETPYTPYVASFGGMKMNRYGKNLCDYTQFKPYSGGTITPVENGFTFTGRYYCSLDGSFLPLGRYYMSWKFESESSITPIWRLQYQDGTYSSMLQNGTGITITQPVKYVLLYHEMAGGTHTATYTDIQLEIGTSATQYEPCQLTEHTADSDGIVKGVKSVSPVTTLVANALINITAEYNKDTVAVVNDLMERIVALEAAIVNN